MGTLITTAALGVALLGGGAALAVEHGPGGGPADSVTSGTSVTDGQLVAALQSPSPSPSPSPGTRSKTRAGVVGKALERGQLARALHAEIVLRGKDGKDVTMLLQRGEITAWNGKTLTVRSADGYSVTWTVGPNAKLRQGKSASAPTTANLAVGLRVGIAGPKDATGGDARVIVLRPSPSPAPSGTSTS